MKDLLDFLNKPETDGDDLVLIIIGCIVFASVAILVFMGMGY